MSVSGNKRTDKANQRAISKKNQDIATSTNNENYISIKRITGCEARNDNFFKAANSMNSHTVLHYAAMRFVYYMVAEAHMQAAVRKFGSISSVPSFICAYLDVEPYFPKGCNSNLSDINDTSIKYLQGAFSPENCGMTGSCTTPQKTSFNGQKCGIVDMGGLVYEVDAGYISIEYGVHTQTFALKGVDLLKSLNENTYTNTENYIQLNLTNRRKNKHRSGWYYNIRVGIIENPIFSFKHPDSNDGSAINDYNCDNFLHTLNTAVSEHGTTAYGQDYNYSLQKDYSPVFGGCFASEHGSYYNDGAGCGLLYFGGDKAQWSASTTTCSARAMIVPN